MSNNNISERQTQVLPKLDFKGLKGWQEVRIVKQGKAVADVTYMAKNQCKVLRN